MSNVLIKRSNLENIASAIRSKNGESTLYKPGEMAAAIGRISGGGYPEPTGTVQITTNGTHNVKDYGSAEVNVSGVIPTWLRDGWALFAHDYNSSNETVDVRIEAASTSSKPKIPESDPTIPIADWVSSLGLFSTNEYYDYVPDDLISKLGLVLLGDFSAGGSATDNVLSDAIDNYSAIWLQGIYNKNKTSNYNTTRIYVEPELDVPYWTGMKDRNSSYTCRVTFTDATHCDLSGNRQVLIYGIP